MPWNQQLEIHPDRPPNRLLKKALFYRKQRQTEAGPNAESAACSSESVQSWQRKTFFSSLVDEVLHQLLTRESVAIVALVPVAVPDEVHRGRHHDGAPVALY